MAFLGQKPHYGSIYLIMVTHFLAENTSAKGGSPGNDEVRMRQPSRVKSPTRERNSAVEEVGRQNKITWGEIEEFRQLLITYMLNIA